MAVLLSNARRIRRKLLSRRLYPVVALLTPLLVLLFFTIGDVSIADDDVSLPQLTTDVDDPTIDWTKVAHVQYAASLEDLCKAVMLFSELKEVFSLAMRVLLYPNTWSINADNSSSTKYAETAPIALLLNRAVEEFHVVLNPTDTIWKKPYTNLLAYNLTQFDRVIVLGYDSIVLNSMDELFFLPPAPLAMPYVYWSKPPGWRLSNQIMVIQPSPTEFERIERAVHGAAEGHTDMDLVQKLYKRSLIRLPQRPYHILTEEFRLREREHSKYLGASGERWNTREIILETKLVHLFDSTIPNPPVASNVTWKHYKPRCFPVAYRKTDCSCRNAWSKFYSNYHNRGKNVCGMSI